MIQTQTFNGLPMGMDTERPPHAVDPLSAVYMQDILLHQPGLMRRRGPVQAVSGSPTIAFKGTGIVATQRYDGTYRVAVLAGDGSAAKIHLLNSTLTAVSTVYNLNGVFANTPRTHMNASSALGGGTLIGTGAALRAGTVDTNLALWKGATKPDYTNAALTATRGSAAVTCTSGFTANVESGMFLFKDAAYTTLIGVVATVTSDTALVLEDPALASIVATNGYFRPLRGLCPRVATGTITVVTTQATVTGQNSKFHTQAMDDGTWDIFRAADMAYVGTVSGVTDDLSLTLTANAAVAMTRERYLGIKRTTAGGGANYDFSTTALANRKLGWLTTTYAGRQWYANRPQQSASNDYASRVWFSDTADLEAVNVSRDGDWFNVQSLGSANTPVIGLHGMTQGLAIFKETELWVLVGSDTSSFSLRKIGDLSLLSPQAVEPYAGGIIFAAAEGVFFYDGVRLENLVAKLGTFYEKAIVGWTTGTDQCRCLVNRGHVFIQFSKYVDPVGSNRNGSQTNPTAVTLIINMATGAIGYATNLQIWGSVDMPPGSGLPTLYIVNTAAGVTSICDSNALFDSTGADAITCDGLTLGPSFYLETPRFDVGDPERKKLFKQVAMQYLLAGTGAAVLAVDTIPGLNAVGTQTVSGFALQASFANKRIKFLKRSTHLGFRLYEKIPTPGPDAITDVRVGPFAIGFKPQRVGRV